MACVLTPSWTAAHPQCRLPCRRRHLRRRPPRRPAPRRHRSAATAGGLIPAQETDDWKSNRVKSNGGRDSYKDASSIRGDCTAIGGDARRIWHLIAWRECFLTKIVLTVTAAGHPGFVLLLLHVLHLLLRSPPPRHHHVGLARPKAAQRAATPTISRGSFAMNSKGSTVQHLRSASLPHLRRLPCRHPHHPRRLCRHPLPLRHPRHHHRRPRLPIHRRHCRTGR